MDPFWAHVNCLLEGMISGCFLQQTVDQNIACTQTMIFLEHGHAVKAGEGYVGPGLLDTNTVAIHTWLPDHFGILKE